jgi:hypothetical protein
MKEFKRLSFATFWGGIRGDSEWDVMDAFGESYESRTQACCAWLGFCGCGNPEGALQTVVDVLSLYVRREWSHEGYQQTVAREREIFGENEGVKYLIWYWISEANLMEHGGSVPGWLTPTANCS